YSSSGALLEDTDVFDLVATHLYAAIGTPFGAASDSVENNSNKSGYEDASGRICNYSAFGVTGLDYSQRLLLQYCASRLSADALASLIGDGMDAVEAQNEAASFLGQIGLGAGRERGPDRYIRGSVGDAYHWSGDQAEGLRPAEVLKSLEGG